MEFSTVSKANKQVGVSYLGNINASAKLEKNGKVSKQHTYGMYLAPATTSGFNTCQSSTPECRMGCLNTSGRAGMEIMAGKTMINDCRVKKTRLFFEDTAFFMQWLIADIKLRQAKAIKEGYGFSVRLNCTSDIDWAHVYVDGKNIFQLFPNVTFYDYTKVATKFHNIAENYHLTFSYTGRNGSIAKRLLAQGFNVAVVFDTPKGHALPETFMGYKVVDGDLTDYRPNDGKGVIVGLRFKRIADQNAQKEVMKSDFVVRVAELTAANVQETKILEVA